MRSSLKVLPVAAILIISVTTVGILPAKKASATVQKVFSNSSINVYGCRKGSSIRFSVYNGYGAVLRNVSIGRGTPNIYANTGGIGIAQWGITNWIYGTTGRYYVTMTDLYRSFGAGNFYLNTLSLPTC